MIGKRHCQSVVHVPAIERHSWEYYLGRASGRRACHQVGSCFFIRRWVGVCNHFPPTLLMLRKSGNGECMFITRSSSYILLTGHQTYGTVLTFILAMAQNPDIQKRAQQEVDTSLSGSHLPRVIDALDMPYVCAVVKETMRWSPVLPMCTS
jgi:hypothetical protein